MDQFARVVRADEKLSGGFNAVGFSQGNTVIRGYIHKYNNPPVKTFLSMHGVLMGVNGLPQCPMSVPGVGVLCRAVDAIVSHAGVYSSFVQNRLAQANYYRDAENLGQYRTHGHFLPYINNEVQGHQNATYKKNFQSLDKLVLVMAEDDTMVHPKESEHFGYFKDGSRTQLVAMRDAPWYTEDWFGLKSLDQAKKIEFHSTPGNHLRFKKDPCHRIFHISFIISYHNISFTFFAVIAMTYSMEFKSALIGNLFIFPVVYVICYEYIYVLRKAKQHLAKPRNHV